jgi:hypothetical protein
MSASGRAGAEDQLARRGSKIALTSVDGMVGVGVSESPVRQAARIDVEVTRGAVEAVVGRDEEESLPILHDAAA